jgi:hypothetical protein
VTRLGAPREINLNFHYKTSKMKALSYYKIGLALAIAVCGVAVAEEVTPTPTAIPTVTSTPRGPSCPSVQSCVSEQVPAVMQSCLAVDQSCTPKRPDRFALTASDLAARAIEAKKCTDPISLQSKIQCNACYRAAKRPLSVRRAGVLFHGLIAQSLKIVEQRRIEACSSLTNKHP